MKEQNDLIAVVLAILATLFVGLYFSPTFGDPKSFMLILMNLVILILAFGLLVTIAYFGFRSFALYGALFTAMVMVMFGLVWVMLVIVMTYVIWGFIFGFEALLVGHRVKSAEEWFKGRYTYQSFYKEYLVFYPMIMVVYTIVEILPCLLGFEKPKRFSSNAILERMKEILVE